MHKPIRFLTRIGAFALATLIFASSALGRDRSPDAMVLATNSPNAIPGQYIVVMNDKTDPRAAASAASFVTANGGEIIHEYSNALHGFAARMPEPALRGLQLNPRVAYIEADQIFSVIGRQTDATWGIDRIDQQDLPLDDGYTFWNSGAGVHAYVLDTGIRFTHQEFDDRASPGFDVLNDGVNGNDCHGHGTHVAGTIGGSIHGVAKNVFLYSVRVLDCDGFGTTSGIIAGVDWVTANRRDPAVANMSLGGAQSWSLSDAVINSVESGVTYAVAAGNEDQDACNLSPADAWAAITVGATNRNDRRWTSLFGSSNWGICVDLFAPGSFITSTGHGSDVATRTMSGTSMAAPHVAGVAALFLQIRPEASPAEVFDWILAFSTKDRLSNIGNNSPNRLLYSLLISGPCDGCNFLSNNLPWEGAVRWEPNSNYYYSSTPGAHRGWLEATKWEGNNFNLNLLYWNGNAWEIVARSASIVPTEYVEYDGPSGYYMWRIDAAEGYGDYHFFMQRP